MAGKRTLIKVQTPIFRVSFPAMFRPSEGVEENGKKGEPKFGLTGLFDEASQKTPEFKAMQDILRKAAIEKWGLEEAKRLMGTSTFKKAFRPGADKSHMEGYNVPGLVFASMTTKQKPGLIAADKSIITDESDFFAGCYARATVTAYAFEKAGNKGVAFGLHNVQKIRNGTSFSGRTEASEDFDEVSDWTEDEGENKATATASADGDDW